MASIHHIEIAGPDGQALKGFYAGLFGWNIQRREVAGFDYYDVDTEPSLGLRPEPEGPAEIVVYVRVDDLQATVERAVELGATVRIPPMSHEGLRFALIVDPSGNPVGLTEAAAR